MKTLIMKDLRSIKLTIAIGYVVTLVWYLSLFTEGKMPNEFVMGMNMAFLYMASMMCILMIINNNLLKRKNINKLLRSLPIKPQNIVISNFFMPIIVLFMFLIPSLIIKIILKSLLNIDLIIPVSLSILIFIIYYIYTLTCLITALLYPEKQFLNYLRVMPLMLGGSICILVENILKKLNIKIDISIIYNYLPILELIGCVALVIGVIYLYKFSVNKFISKEL